MRFGEKLRSLRKEKGIKQYQLAEAIGMNRHTISRYEKGTSSNISYETLHKISEYFEIPLIELVDGVDEEPIKSIRIELSHGVRQIEEYTNDDLIPIKVYGSVPAGIPVEAIEDITGEVLIPKSYFKGNKEFIALEVKGSSMYPLFLEGDTVIVELTPDFNNGDSAVVYINGFDATLKKIYRNLNGTITLKPVNPEYQEKTYGHSDEEIKVLGIVRELRRVI